ncbi:MAG: hypothetical protein JWO53_831 [Chlamydiia bacterium]|nr:hypothetical protein [Chlamydiia bacterium]
MTLVNISNQCPYHFLAVTPPHILRPYSLIRRSITQAGHVILFIIDKVKELVRDVFIYLGIIKPKKHFKFKELPQALQAFASGFLDPQTLLRLTSTSREFRNLRIAFLKGHSAAIDALINYTGRDLDGLHTEDQTALKEIGPTIHHLTLSKLIRWRNGCAARSWTQNEIEKVVEFFPNLTSLNFHLVSPFDWRAYLFVKSINDDGLQKLCALPYLKSLDLTKGATLGVDALSSMVRKLPYLEELYVEGSPITSGVEVSSIIKNRQQLKKLEIRKSDYSNSIKDLLFQLPMYLQELECLIVNEGPVINDEIILALIKGLPDLQSLSLQSCSLVTASGLFAVCKILSENPRKLQELQLNGFNSQLVSEKIRSEVREQLRQPLQRVIIR